MPDVTRSESQRSDASLRPRVSFNRDVHVKRIVPRESGRAAGYLSEGEAYGSLVKKKPLSKSKEKLQKEAAKVAQKVGKLECIAKDNGIPPDKFYTLPVRKKSKKPQSNPSSRRRNSTELQLTPPKKPPRTFATLKRPEPPKKSSIFGVFKPKKSNLTRSVSDATNSKSRPDKKQLSPIIELTQREDYFHNAPGERSVTDLLKEYIGELDSAEQGVVVIDVEKAEQIEDKSKGGGLGKRLKSIVGKKGPSEMIHSSQKPAEKLPLTRGRTVDNMVKRLSHENGSPHNGSRLWEDRPPLSSVLITPNVSMQHNNNQPFSYTRGLSPERPSNPSHPIIYAQVVCGNNGVGGKQTVHAAYSNGKKHLPHSDSDEGLGYEENTGFRTMNVRHFGDDRVEEDFITPSYKRYDGNKYAKQEQQGYFIDSSSRGRGDGMDAKRRESLTETDAPLNVSARRDLLESRINRRVYSPKTSVLHVSDYRSGSASPEVKHHSNNRTFETEPKSFDSHTDYPERLANKRDFYKSSPEIYHHQHYTSKVTNRKTSEKPYYDGKDKFGDSGIENDLSRRKLSNESEDEGFASSLLIASERQHTEDNLAKQRQQNYDSDTGHHVLTSEKVYRQEYIPRERSIDDGSHFDPRLDRDRATLKKTDKKPPKPEKKSSLEKMKQLFSGTKKKKDKPGMVREESLRARYTEYKGGSSHTNDSKIYKKDSELNTNYEYNDRRHMSTPSPSSARALDRNVKSEASHGSWFKSLDRLSRKKTKKEQKEGNMTSTEDETTKPPTKSLRFFGDTDAESSNDSVRRKSALKTRSGLSHHDRTRSQSSGHLHNITEELYNSKSMQNIAAVDSDRDYRSSRLSLKPPASPNHRNREVLRSREDRSRRRKNEVSSVESSTEGDSSQQSQRSVVYLHAATVGDIPGPGYLRNGRRAASREELASNTSSRMQPQVKTLSRSFSVLAPWKPRHYKDGVDIDYAQYPTKPAKNGKYEQNRNGTSRKESSSTLKKRAQETARKSTLNRRSHSKENVRGGEYRGSSSSLYKKKERQPKETTNRYTRDDKKMTGAKSMSVESLRNNNREVSRSVSMPRDPQKSAGWFTMNRKNKKSVSTQRL